jgi:hypothetical protein
VQAGRPTTNALSVDGKGDNGYRLKKTGEKNMVSLEARTRNADEVRREYIMIASMSTGENNRI